MKDGAAKSTARLVTLGLRLNVGTLRKSIAGLEARTRDLLVIERDFDALYDAALDYRIRALEVDAKLGSAIKNTSWIAELKGAMPPDRSKMNNPAELEGRIEAMTKEARGMWPHVRSMRNHAKEQARSMGKIDALVRKEEEGALFHYRLFERAEALLKAVVEEGMRVDGTVQAEFEACLEKVMEKGSESTDIKKRVAVKAAQSRELVRDIWKIEKGVVEKHMRLYNMLFEMGADVGGARNRLRRAWRGLWSGSGRFW